MDKEQILYEDKEIIVCHKPAGIATQTAKVGQQDMVSEVTNYLAVSMAGKPKGNPYVGVIHRLDQPVEGILVFAKNQKAANALSKQMTNNQMQKKYYAVIAKDPKRRMGTLVDYLYKDGKTNMSYVVLKEHKGAKRAELFYEVEGQIRDKESWEIALVSIKLVTGRHHQIRVQMSHAGMCLLGDFKYADEETKKLSERLGQKQVALCAYELGFEHPVTGKQMIFHKEPEGEIFQIFNRK